MSGAYLRPDDPRALEAVALYESGMTSGEIAAKLGVHPSTVLHRMRAAGHEPRGRAEQGAVRRGHDRLPRFMQFIREVGGCWIWQAHVGRLGYGSARVNRRTVLIHRWFYERLVGPVPEGLQLDHLCRNRACVNPDHLEPVTMRENILRGFGFSGRNARKTHCAQGHPFAGDNVRLNKGHRVCRTCARAWSRACNERRALREKAA